MKALLIVGAMLLSAAAQANDIDQWKKSNPYNAKLPEPVSTMAISGVNIRLGTSLERLTLLSGEGNTGKKLAGAFMAVGLTMLGGAEGTDTAAREPLHEHFSDEDARKIAAEIAESIQQHLVVPDIAIAPLEQVAAVDALRSGKVSYEVKKDAVTLKAGRFKPEYFYGYYTVPAEPYGYRAKPKLGYAIGDGEIAPAVRAATGAQAAVDVDVFLVNNRKAMQVQELKVSVLTPQMIGRGRDTPVFVFELPEGSLAVPLSGASHKDNYVLWQQMRPGFEAKLADLGLQIRAALDKGR